MHQINKHMQSKYHFLGNSLLFCRCIEGFESQKEALWRMLKVRFCFVFSKYFLQGIETLEKKICFSVGPHFSQQTIAATVQRLNDLCPALLLCFPQECYSSFCNTLQFIIALLFPATFVLVFKREHIRCFSLKEKKTN